MKSYSLTTVLDWTVVPAGVHEGLAHASLVVRPAFVTLEDEPISMPLHTTVFHNWPQTLLSLFPEGGPSIRLLVGKQDISFSWDPKRLNPALWKDLAREWPNVVFVPQKHIAGQTAATDVATARSDYAKLKSPGIRTWTTEDLRQMSDASYSPQGRASTRSEDTATVPEASDLPNDPFLDHLAGLMLSPVVARVLGLIIDLESTKELVLPESGTIRFHGECCKLGSAVKHICIPTVFEIPAGSKTAFVALAPKAEARASDAPQSRLSLLTSIGADGKSPVMASAGDVVGTEFQGGPRQAFMGTTSVRFYYHPNKTRKLNDPSQSQVLTSALEWEQARRIDAERYAACELLGLRSSRGSATEERYLDDLIVGWRLTVRFKGRKEWYSPYRRITKILGRDGKEISIGFGVRSSVVEAPENGEDEAWRTMSIQRGPTGLYDRMPDILEEWSGGNLACPDPLSRKTGPDQAGTRVKLIRQVPRKSLVHLLLNRNYEFVFRPVDAAGLDVSAYHPSYAIEKLPVVEHRHRRERPISPPLLFGGHNPDAPTWVTRLGGEPDAKLVAPPPGARDVAEQSGRMLPLTDREFLSILQRLNEHAVAEDGRAVAYLPDPDAGNVRIELKDLQSAGPTGFARTEAEHQTKRENRTEAEFRYVGGWPDAVPAKVAAVPVKPPAGREKRLDALIRNEKTTVTEKDYVALFGVAAHGEFLAGSKDMRVRVPAHLPIKMRLYSVSDTFKQSDRPLEAEMRCLSPYPVFRPRLSIIGPQAVPAPEPCQGQSNSGSPMALRGPDDHEASLAVTALFHAPTTGKLELHARVKDITDDLTLKPSEIAAKERPWAFVWSAGKIDPTAGKLIAGVLQERKAVLKHDLETTRYVKADYKLVAHPLESEPSGESRLRTEESKEKHPLEFYSTAKPPKPVVTRVLPIYRRSVGPGEGGIVRQFDSGLRVYCARPWYVTGLDEQLGVMLDNCEFGNDAAVKEKAEFGLVFKPDQDPSRSVLARLRDTPSSITALGPEAEVQSGNTKSLTPSDKILRIRPLADDELDEWYFDIDVSAKGDKCPAAPFIRLAVARIQPASISDELRFSDTVYAPWIWLPPRRKVIFERYGSDIWNLAVTVTGPDVFSSFWSYRLTARSGISDVSMTGERDKTGRLKVPVDALRNLPPGSWLTIEEQNARFSQGDAEPGDNPVNCPDLGRYSITVEELKSLLNPM